MPFGPQNAAQIYGSMIGPVAVNTTTAETIISGQLVGTWTFLNNNLLPGNVIRIKGKGIFSSSGATTKIFKVKIGAAVFTFGTYTASGALSNRPFTLDWQGTVELTGASGTVFGNGEILLYEVAGAAPLSVTQSGTTATTLDTTGATAALLIVVTCTEGNSNVADSVTLQQLTAELLQ